MTRPRVVLFSQGDEVLTGQTVDTNAAWLAQQLDGMGFDICRHITVGDRLEDLVAAMHGIAEQADLCVCSGGLGPTQDDLTAEAVARAFDRELQLDQEALQQIEAFYQQRGRTMPAVNRKQAMLPTGAQRLDNHWGTAPGFSLQVDSCLFFFVPGVPYEMRQLFQQSIVPVIQNQFHIRAPRRVILRSFGLGESNIQEQLDQLQLDDDIEVSFRAGLPENELKLRFPADSREDRVRETVERVRASLGDAVFAIDGLDHAVKDMPAWVDQCIRRKRLALVLLESLSLGRVASQCQAEWLLQALVMPSVEDAASHFDVPRTTSTTLRQLAKQIASRMRIQTSAPMALVQLWQPGDDEDAPVELVTALASNAGVKVREHRVHGRWQRRQIMAAAYAFDLLRQVVCPPADIAPGTP